MHADLVVLASIKAAAAVLRVGLRVDAAAAALCGRGLLAVGYTNSVLTEWSIAAALIANSAAVLRAGLEVDTLAVDKCQTGFAHACTVIAILRVATLGEAIAAVLRIVFQIAADVTATAGCQTADATANTAVAKTKRVVAVVSARAAVVDVGREDRTCVVASHFAHGANALTRDTGRSIRTIIAARTAVVHVDRDVGARVAAGDLARRANARPGNAGGTHRTKYAATAAACLVGGHIDTADISTAVDRSTVANAGTRNAHAGGAALDSASAAVVGIA